MRKKQTRLRLERLEERCLLTTVEVFASGQVGDEAFDVLVDDRIVRSFELDSTAPRVFAVQTSETITADQIKIRFTNDSFDPITGADRNLIVDKIALDGVDFQTEHPSTFSTATFQSETSAIIPGFWQADYLSTDGYFQFANQAATTIQVTARGVTGQESIELVIRNDQVMASWDLATTEQTYTATLDEMIDISKDPIQIRFVDSSALGNQSIVVNRIVVNGQTLETEASTTFTSSDSNSGYLQTETLDESGSLQYLASPSTVLVRASGDEGTEDFKLVVDGQVVQTTLVTTSFQDYVYQHPGPLTANDVRVVFDNDVFDAIAGIDTNLNVDYVEVDGERFESEGANTFAVGAYSVIDDSVAPGYGRGSSLNANGYFQYSSGATLAIEAKGTTGSESFRLIYDGDFVGQFDVSTGFETFQFVGPDSLAPERVRIEYEDSSVSGELVVDWIEVNGVRYETESPTTFSLGTSQSGGQSAFGFGLGDTLTETGFFQWQAVPIKDLSYSLPEDSIDVPLALLDEPSAPGFPVNIDQYSAPTNGSLNLVDGQLLYSPNIDFAGTDSFTFNVTSVGGTAPSVVATVEITVNASHEQSQTAVNSAISPELAPSGKSLLVRKVAKLPRGDTGRHARMNSLATIGDRIFIVDDGAQLGEGKIYELVEQTDGTRNAELFLNAGEAIFQQTGLNIDNSSPLNGLRSVAFHPEFETNGKLFISYTGQRPADPTQFFYLSDPPNPVAVESVLAEFTFDFQNNQVDTSSYREVFRVGMFNSEHSIRNVVFNKYAQPGDEDYGLLYIGHGDGSEQSAIAGSGQLSDALGKILRINPLQNGSAPYSVPTSNPFVGDSGMLDEVYAIGFRNPHNLTFTRDSVGSIQLIVTEIGRDNLEEVNIVVAGGNYGWAEREGVLRHLKDQVGVNGSVAPLPADDAQNDFIYPVTIYGHEAVPGTTFAGQALGGGHVITNGSTELDGQFVFVEFSTDSRAFHIDFAAAQQQVTTLDPNDPSRDEPSELTWLDPQELTILFDHDSDESTPPLVRDSLRDVLNDDPEFTTITTSGKVRADLRLGEGPNGELYILNKRNSWVYVAKNTIAPDNQSFLVTEQNDELDARDIDLRTFDPDDLSLREAITLANIDPTTTNRIEFGFTTSGSVQPFQITLESPLPTVVGPTIIDATTQPGYIGTPKVGINGANTINADGLRIEGIGSSVQGLAIYGFDQDAIELVGGSNHTISDNFLGLNAYGDQVGNSVGLRLTDSTANTVDGNTISANQSFGVVVSGENSIHNQFTSNFVGTDATGSIARPNIGGGISVKSPSNVIGKQFAGNVISGNDGIGVSLGPEADRSIVQGNRIGTNLAGDAPLPNSTIGIRVASNENLIGGESLKGNVISANGRQGIVVTGSDNTKIAGNRIGTDWSGNAAIGNQSYGIFVNNSQDIEIGGETTSLTNVVSANGQSGIAINASSNVNIQRNKIGVSTLGDTVLPNGGSGVFVYGGSSNNSVLSNQISGNLGTGISIISATAQNNVVQSNLIGTNGDSAQALTNGAFGILVASPANTIGGENTNGNIVASSLRGIVLTGPHATGNVVTGNFVGTNPNLAAAYPMATGIQIAKSASANVIGPNNTIANTGTGIRLLGSSGSQNRITRNEFRGSSVIEIDLGNLGPTPNDVGDLDEGPNRTLNYPEIQSANIIGDDLVVDLQVPAPTTSASFDLDVEIFVAEPVGQIIRYIGSVVYSSSDFAVGIVSKTIVGAASSVQMSGGDTILAVAIDSLGNTSEFSTPATIGSTNAFLSSSRSPLDVSGDGQITPFDALSVMNFMSDTSESPSTGELPRSLPVDTNRDGTVTPFDALLIIDWLSLVERESRESETIERLVDDVYAEDELDFAPALLF